MGGVGLDRLELHEISSRALALGGYAEAHRGLSVHVRQDKAVRVEAETSQRRHRASISRSKGRARVNH